MHLHGTTLTTPVGPFTLLVDGGGVCAAGFTGRAETLQRRLDPQRRAATTRPADDPDGVSSAMLAYLHGELDALEGLTVAQPGDPPQLAAWQALRSVPAPAPGTDPGGSEWKSFGHWLWCSGWTGLGVWIMGRAPCCRRCARARRGRRGGRPGSGTRSRWRPRPRRWRC
jgi:hypothetical protein